MSTAGKVLAVLVALATVAWLLMIAKVADLNANWGERVDKATKEYVKLQEDLESAEARLAKLRADTDALQVATMHEVGALRAHLSTVEKAYSEVMDALTRVQLQVASQEGQTQAAQAARDQREKEFQETQKLKADTEQDLQRLQAENAALLAELTKLRDQFATTLAENRRLLDQMRRASGRESRPAALLR